MTTIEQSGFSAKGEVRTDEWIRELDKALHTLGNGIAKMAWVVHREPDFREQNLLDRNLGPVVRRTWW